MQAQVMVCGDFKFDLMDCSHPQAILLYICDCVITGNLLHPIITPMQITDWSATHLDIYISHISKRDCKVCYILSWPWVSATTQLSVVTYAGKNPSHSPGIWSTDPGGIDLNKFREDLSHAPLSVMSSFNSTNYKMFLQLLNDHALLQLRTLHIMEQSPSVTRDIQDQMDMGDKSF